MNNANPSDNMKIIHQYTRSQALTDGILIDVTDTAREVGLKFPTAVTAAVWDDTITWDPTHLYPQDEIGRLWDVLTCARAAATTCPGDTHVTFQVFRVPNTADAVLVRPVDLVLTIGQGDTPAPVLTVFALGED